MTEYLPEDVVIAINARFGGYPLDGAGIDAAIYRPATSAFGQDAFADLWTKAGVYVHSFSSTQYFSDGNKRTAWTTAVTFLELNGYRLREVPDVEAEAFVLAVSRQLFNTEDAPQRTLERAGEWFRVNTTPLNAVEVGHLSGQAQQTGPLRMTDPIAWTGAQQRNALNALAIIRASRSVELHDFNVAAALAVVRDLVPGEETDDDFLSVAPDIITGLANVAAIIADHFSEFSGVPVDRFLGSLDDDLRAMPTAD